MNFRPFQKLAVAAMLCAALAGCDSTSTTTLESSETTTTVSSAAIYVAGNSSGANSVLTYTRDAAGTLALTATTATGGSGSGIDNDSGGNSIYLDRDTNLLYVVNTGSDSISLFYAEADGSLNLLDVTASGGVNPISLAVNYDVMFVLNAGEAGTPANIKGFQIAEGRFVEISGAEAFLTTALPGACKIQYAPGGNLVTVTEKDTGVISNFVLDANLVPTLVSTASAGATPSGFDYTSSGLLIVAERFADAAGAGSVSSYVFSEAGVGTTISSSTALGQSETNSVKTLISGSYALVTNSGSNNVSVVAIGSDGSLSTTGETETTGSIPSEIVTTDDEAFAYVLNTGDDSISSFTYSSGNLTALSSITGLPTSARGITGR